MRSRELQFACVFLHQIFDKLQSDNLPKSKVDRLGSGSCAKHLHGFVD